MKYKLLSVHNGNINNIGDYVQALASSQFLPQIDGFINREQLDEYNGEECKMIMNGWYMHNTEHWPPSKHIKPLFVAFHLNTSAANGVLTPDGIEYLKKHEPIGCRDTNTVRLLTEKGIQAYFSGCMTLTLGLKYQNNCKDDTYYFVDPIIPKSKNVSVNILNAFYFFFNKKQVSALTQKLYQKNNPSIKQKIITAGFIRLYSKIISKSIIFKAKFICQENSYYNEAFNDDFERLNEAERLVKLYSKAKLVVTSRIHCALPCLGLNTPVLFTMKENDSEISSCRFGGLVDLFNTITCHSQSVTLSANIKYVDSSNIPQNKTTWMVLANKLIQTCTDFIKS